MSIVRNTLVNNGCVRYFVCEDIYSLLTDLTEAEEPDGKYAIGNRAATISTYITTPLNVSETSDPITVTLLGKDVGSYRRVKDTMKNNTSVTVNARSLLPKYIKNTYLNSSKYCTATIYLPGLGWNYLNFDLIKDGNLTIYISANIITGDIFYEINSTAIDFPIAHFRGNVNSNEPIGTWSTADGMAQYYQTARDVENELKSDAVKAGLGLLATQDITGLIGLVQSAFNMKNNAETAKGRVVSEACQAGSVSSALGVIAGGKNIVLRISYPEIADGILDTETGEFTEDFKLKTGIPCEQAMSIGTLAQSGKYTLVSGTGGHYSISGATSLEIAEISDHLYKGVLI